MNYAASYQDMHDPTCDAIHRTERAIASHEEIARERASDFFDVADNDVLGFAVFETVLRAALRSAFKASDPVEIGHRMAKAIATARADYINLEWRRIATYRVNHGRWPTVWPQAMRA